MFAAGCLACTSPPTSIPEDAVSTPVFPGSAPVTPAVTPSPAAKEMVAEPVQAPREVTPGIPIGAEGRRLSGANKPLSFMLIETRPELPACTIACWPALQPALATALAKSPQHYTGSTIAVDGDKFVKFTPSHPLSFKVQKRLAKPGPGLLLVDSKGALLVTLGSAPIPPGFFIAGQASVNFDSVTAWKKDPAIRVSSAGGLQV